MADQLQLRGGTTAEHSTFTGALREVTVDTDKDTVVVHDGSTAGGHPLAKQNLSNVPAGTITSTMIADGTIVNADINASAAIDKTKISGTAITAGDTGTVTSTMIADGTIVNADVNASAAIAGTKIAPDFGSQTIQTTGVVSHALGTAAAPTLTFTGDTNTGIYSPGADQVAISTNGTGRLFVDASGNVGVGASPSYALDVSRGAGNGISARFRNSGGSAGYVYNSGTDTVYFTGDTSVNNAIGFNSTSNYVSLFSGNGTERMRLDSSGRLGLGSSSPQGLLDLAGTKNLSSDIGQLIVRDSASYATGVGGAIVLVGKYNSAGSYTAGAYINTRKENATDGNYSFALGFGTIANGGAISEKMTLTSGGSLGVGTTSPSTDLHVSKAASTEIRVSGTANGSSATIGVYGTPSGGGSRDISLKYDSSSDTYKLVTTTGNDITIGNSAGEAMRIDGSRRVGIGTSSPSSLLHLKGANPQLIVDTPDASTEPRIRLYKNGSPVGQFYGESGVTRILTEGAFQVMTNGGTNAVYVDTSQRVGISNAIPGSFDSQADDLVVGTGSGHNGATIYAGTGSWSSVYFADGTTGSDKYRGIQAYDHSVDAMLWYTAATERARIDSSGRLLVGTASAPTGSGLYSPIVVQGYIGDPTGASEISIQRGKAATAITSGSDIGYLKFNDNAGNTFARIECFADADAGTGDYPGRLVFSTTADGASSPTERMRIGSNGIVYVGVTSASATNSGTVASQGYHSRSGISGSFSSNIFNIYWNGSAARLWIDNSDLGTISLSSDYRIKKNIETISSSCIERVKQLRPVQYELADYENLFKADGIVREGFIAHEVQEVIPSGAEGHKDEENRIQNLRTDAIVAVLTKALQEAISKIENLEAKVAALESV